MGHNLGANHDGPGQDITLACPETDHFVMSPKVSYENMYNIHRFSTCSVAQFKKTLLNTDGYT